MYRRRRKPWVTASTSLGSRAAGVRACRLVALPDPDRATGSRPLIHSGSYRKQRVDRPLRQLYFIGRPIEIPIPAELKKILVDKVLDDAPCLISGEFEHLADFVHVDLTETRPSVRSYTARRRRVL